MEKTAFQITATQSDWEKFKTVAMNDKMDEQGLLYLYKATVYEDEPAIEIEGIGCTEGEQELELWAQYVKYPDGDCVLRFHAGVIDWLAQAQQFDDLTEEEKEVLDWVMKHFKVNLEEGTVEYK